MKRTGNLLTSGLTLGLVVALLSGCAGTATVTPPAAQPAAQSAPPQLDAAKQPRPEAIPLEGKVVETMNAGGYTYISLEKDGKKGWVAVPGAEVAVGQEIKVKPGTEMGLFSSRTLKRSFDNIIFSPGLVTDANSQPTQIQPAAEGAMKLPAGHKAVDINAKPRGMAEMMNAPAGGEAKGDLSGKVVETMDAGGYTYIKLEKDGKQTWAAVPTMKVTVGEEMDLLPGAVMTNFTSKSLNKTFESVVFSGGPVHSK
jgi:uncharacterized protein YuzE